MYSCDGADMQNIRASSAVKYQVHLPEMVIFLLGRSCLNLTPSDSINSLPGDAAFSPLISTPINALTSKLGSVTS